RTRKGRIAEMVQRPSWCRPCHPRSPASLQHVHVSKRQFTADSIGDGSTGVATVAITIDNDAPGRTPLLQQSAYELLPFVFIEQDGAWNMTSIIIPSRPAIYPQ